MAWYEWGNRLSRLLKQQVDRVRGTGARPDMTWEEFGDRLLRVLVTMKDRVHLSIEMPEIGDYRSISLSTSP